MKHEFITDDFIRRLPEKMDFSCVRAVHCREELRNLIELARKYKPACVFVLPSLTQYLAEQLQDVSDVRIGGAVGFPSGGDTTAQKVFQAKELCHMGCSELDMVMNLTYFKIGNDQLCLKDIQSVADSAGNIPLKVIIEASLLTEDEICRASELAVRGGASFVKTGTGWAGAVTVRQVELIYRTIGDSVKIKAAGGIRTFDTIQNLYLAGCDRFGVGVGSAEEMLREAEH